MTPQDDIIPGSTNVFRDLGFPNPEVHQLKAGLVSALNRLIQEGGWTLQTAAEHLGMHEDHLHDVTQGHFKYVTLDELVQTVFQLGGVITLAVHPSGGSPDAVALKGDEAEIAPPTGQWTGLRRQGRDPGEGETRDERRHSPSGVPGALLSGMTPEAVGGELDWGTTPGGYVKRIPPTSEDLFAQVTGLHSPQMDAVLHQGAAVPSTVGGHQIAVNLAALLRLPWQDVLPVLGIRSGESVASRDVLLQTYRILDIFAIVLAALDADDAAHWFTRPNRHLDDQRPLELCQTTEGEHQLRDHLASLLSGSVG